MTKRVVRLDELTPPQRRLVLALVAAQKAAEERARFLGDLGNVLKGVHCVKEEA